MHADQMEDIEAVSAGYIGALFGIECASGDTFVSPGINLTMTSMFVPEPVISLAIFPKDNKSQINMSKALNRFTKEDPTFRTHVDEETNETIIEGMGELHLEIYVERMKREYGAEVETGKPRVAYRETITQRAEFNYTHKKQTGGSGQYGRVAGYMEPITEGTEDFIFDNQVRGGSIPTQYIAACEKGFRQCMAKGPKMEFPVTGVKIVINDGASHAVDSSDMAFQAAARGAFREGYAKAKPVIHEPIMKVVVEIADRISGGGDGSPQSATGDDRRGAGRRGHDRRRGAGPAGRNVRFFDGSEILHPGQGPVHHGICPLSAGAAIHRGEDCGRGGPAEKKRGMRSGASIFFIPWPAGRTIKRIRQEYDMLKQELILRNPLAASGF